MEKIDLTLLAMAAYEAIKKEAAKNEEEKKTLSHQTHA